MKKELFLALFNKLQSMGLGENLLTKEGIGTLSDEEVKYLIEIECEKEIFEQTLLLYQSKKRVKEYCLYFLKFNFNERKEIISLILSKYNDYKKTNLNANYKRKYIDNIDSFTDVMLTYLNNKLGGKSNPNGFESFESYLRLAEKILLSKHSGWKISKVACDINVLNSGKANDLIEVLLLASGGSQIDYACKVACNPEVLKTDYAIVLTGLVAAANGWEQASCGVEVACDPEVLKTDHAIGLTSLITKSKEEYHAKIGSKVARNSKVLKSSYAVKLTELVTTADTLNEIENTYKLVISLGDELLFNDYVETESVRFWNLYSSDPNLAVQSLKFDSMKSPNSCTFNPNLAVQSFDRKTSEVSDGIKVKVYNK